MATISVVIGNCAGANSVTLNETVTVGTAIGANDTFTGFKNQNISGDVSTNDTGCSVGATSYVTASSPTNGTLVSFNQSGIFEYTPNNGFIGVDTFTYNIRCDGVVQGSPITVTLQVIGAVAVNDSITLNANTPTQFDLKTNDIPCNLGANTVYSIISPPTNGIISGFSGITAIGTYTPNANYYGSDTLTYNVLCNGTITATATMTFNVSCIGITTAIITGNMNPVGGSTESYTATNQDGTPLYTYNWTITGGTILSGQGTSTVTIKWD